MHIIFNSMCNVLRQFYSFYSCSPHVWQHGENKYELRMLPSLCPYERCI